MKNLFLAFLVLFVKFSFAQIDETNKSILLIENNGIPYNSSNKGLLYYNVYVNNLTIPIASTTETNYEIESALIQTDSNGVVTFCIGAVYLTGISELTCISIYSPPHNIQTIEKDKIKIYPNPAKDLLNINSNNEIQSIKIFNILGKELSFIEVNNKDYKMDLSDFQAGFYLISTKTENGESIQKINIVK